MVKVGSNRIERNAHTVPLEETAALLAHLGSPLAPLSTVPPAPLNSVSRPATPSRLSRSFETEDNDVLGGHNASDVSVAKKDEMSHRLGQLIEELVRTERSYFGRIEALKTVSVAKMARKQADIRWTAIRRPSPPFRKGSQPSADTSLSGEYSVRKHRPNSTCLGCLLV